MSADLARGLAHLVGWLAALALVSSLLTSLLARWTRGPRRARLVAARRLLGLAGFGLAVVHALASIGTGLDDPNQGDVHVLELPPTVVYSPDFARFRREARCKALVIVTKGQAPGLALLNAEAFKRPHGPPILQVSSTVGPRLLAAVRRGAALRVVIRSRRTRTQARRRRRAFTFAKEVSASGARSARASAP